MKTTNNSKNKVKSSKDKYHGLLPRNLNFEKLLSDHPPQLSYWMNNPAMIRDNCIYILSSIIYARQQLEAAGYDLSRPEYVSLASKILQATISNYLEYIEYFIKYGVIERDESYRVGHYCMGYRFSAKYSDFLDPPQIQIIKNPSVLRRIYKFKKDKIIINKYQGLYNSFSGLSVDWDHATLILDQLYSNPENVHKKEIQDDNLRAVEDKRRWIFKTCETNRLFTHISHLRSELRAALRYSYTHHPIQPLVSIDIKNSIPYFSLSLFNHNVFHSYNLNKILKKYNRNLFKKEELELLPFVMLRKIQDSVGKYADVQHFIDNVLNGEIYEILMDHWNVGLNKNYSREEAKRTLLKILNSPSIFGSPEKELFADLYPNVIKAVDEINGYFKTKRVKNKSPKDKKAPFAHYTQIVESWFVLDVVCREILKTEHGCPLFTIHDAIFTTPQNVDLVVSVILERSKDIFQNPCEVKVK